VRPAEPETHWRAPLGRWRPSFVVEFVVGIFLDCQKLFATVTDDPMKVAMRQIAGTFAQLEKARLVAKFGNRSSRTGDFGGSEDQDLSVRQAIQTGRGADGRANQHQEGRDKVACILDQDDFDMVALNFTP
jgi:hypothetical protein